VAAAAVALVLVCLGVHTLREAPEACKLNTKILHTYFRQRGRLAGPDTSLCITVYLVQANVPSYACSQQQTAPGLTVARRIVQCTDCAA
jgi:hypothetical protein